MSFARCAAAAALAAVALSACGVAAKPQAGSASIRDKTTLNGSGDDPRTQAAACLTGAGFQIHEYTNKQSFPTIQVDTAPSGPRIVFVPTPDYATGLEIRGATLGAEVIGQALLYPNDISDQQAKIVEHCTAIGVTS